jgi:hypothetical protein
MKLAGLILSFYLILLATMPCCAFDDCQNDKMEQTANHENEDSDCGNCSPFFSCEGCASATISYHPVQIGIPAIQILSVYASYLQLSLPQAVYDFWQPPRLG